MKRNINRENSWPPGSYPDSYPWIWESRTARNIYAPRSDLIPGCKIRSPAVVTREGSNTNVSLFSKFLPAKVQDKIADPLQWLQSCGTLYVNTRGRSHETRVSRFSRATRGTQRWYIFGYSVVPRPCDITWCFFTRGHCYCRFITTAPPVIYLRGLGTAL